MKSAIYSFLTSLLLIANCAVQAQLAAQHPANPPAIVGQASAVAAPAPPIAESVYRLGVADKVRLTVYNEPTLTGEYIVNSDGALSLPLIGDVPVKNKTSADVVNQVTRLYADGFLRDPKVSLDVLTYRPYYILGEVSKPGEYPYSNGLTVMNAVATAEGFTYRASKSKVFIKHAGEQEEKKYPLSPDLSVAPGDTIRVGERYF